MKANKIVAITETTASEFGGSIAFAHKFPLVVDHELCSILLAHREDGFPSELSAETSSHMRSSMCKAILHSWIRLFGLQVAYLRYSELESSKFEVKISLSRLIDQFTEILNSSKLPDAKMGEPRLIFWFEGCDE